MLPLILIPAAAMAWIVLAAVGVRRALCCRVVVYRSWLDFILTAVVAGLLVIDLISCRWPGAEIQIVRILTLVVVPPWLWMTTVANQRAGDLCVVVPAKLTLVVLAGFCAALAYGCASTALSGKADTRTRVANAVLAAGSAAATWRFIRLVRQLITASSSVPIVHRRTFHVDCHSWHPPAQ